MRTRNLVYQRNIFALCFFLIAIGITSGCGGRLLVKQWHDIDIHFDPQAHTFKTVLLSPDGTESRPDSLVCRSKLPNQRENFVVLLNKTHTGHTYFLDTRKERIKPGMYQIVAGTTNADRTSFTATVHCSSAPMTIATGDHTLGGRFFVDAVGCGDVLSYVRYIDLYSRPNVRISTASHNGGESKTTFHANEPRQVELFASLKRFATDCLLYDVKVSANRETFTTLGKTACGYDIAMEPFSRELLSDFETRLERCQSLPLQ